MVHGCTIKFVFGFSLFRLKEQGVREAKGTIFGMFSQRIKVVFNFSADNDLIV